MLTIYYKDKRKYCYLSVWDFRKSMMHLFFHNKIRQFAVIAASALFLSCSPSRQVQNELPVISNPNERYYVTAALIQEGTHPHSIGGIGSSFDYGLLKKDNIENFKESFYEQLTYTPIPFSSFYWGLLECLGYVVDAEWINKFDYKYEFGETLREYKLTLEDGNYFFVEVSKLTIAEDVEFAYLENKECMKPSSIEIDIRDVKNARLMAILMPKKQLWKKQ